MAEVMPCESHNEGAPPLQPQLGTTSGRAEIANVRFDTQLSFAQSFESPAEAKRQIIYVANALQPKPHFNHGDMLFLQLCGDLAPKGDVSRNVWLNGPEAIFRLKLVKADQWVSYLAVSYCWPTTTEDESDGYNPVTIECLDGSTRKSRAPAKVLHRAIRQAWSLDKTHIWIDQECIDQSDPVQKELAIQSMDSVYRGASSVLCLLNCTLEEEEDVHLLESLHHTNRGGPSGQFDSMVRAIGGLQFTNKEETAVIFRRIFDTLSADRYWTRAWILQERLCSRGISSTEVWANCAFGLPTTVPGDVCVNLPDQVRDAQELIQQMEDDQMMEEAQILKDSLKRLQRVYLLPEAADHRRQNARTVSQFYNALQVTRVLQSQDCLIHADKIALLANCLGWNLRLDTNEAKAKRVSFSACIWAMALMNGDGSIFCQDPLCLKGSQNFRHWAPRSSTIVSKLNCTGLIDHVSLQKIDESGLASRGWLFRTTARIDLNELQAVSKENEAKAWNTNISISDEEGVSDDNPYSRDNSLIQKFFWALMKRLVLLKHHQAAELLWKATKYRARGGFYGRDLVEIDSNNTLCFAGDIIDADTGVLKVTLRDLNLESEQLAEVEPFSRMAYVGYALHRHCRHRDPDWNGDESEPDCLLDPLSNDNAFRLLGNDQQLDGFRWIYDSVMENGCLGVGELVESHDTTSKTPEGYNDFCSDSQASETETQKPKNRALLFNLETFEAQCLPQISATDTTAMDNSPSHRAATHVYVQHQEVMKYKSGDGKPRYLVHPFEIWHKDRRDHQDAPLAWSSRTRETSEGVAVVDIDEPRHCVFDIQDIPEQLYTLGWPEEYDKDAW